MERISRLEYGGGGQRSFESSASSEMDMDFNDVFGGPPRRFSIQEATRTRYSFNGSMESEEDSSDLSRSSWTGFSEKPVFGAENVANIRRNQGGDFYDDIFRADESCSPGSRVTLPQKNEAFGTSLPVQFSLPAKLTKPTDLPLFASGSHTHKAKNDAPTFYRQSPLSREVTTIGDELKYMSESDEQVIGENLKTNEENNHQFHFSIYKWAGKGVAILMPLRGGKHFKSKEEIKTEMHSRSLLGDHLKISRDVNFHSFSTRSNISERSGSAYGVVEETETPSIPKSKSLQNVNDATPVKGTKLTTEREAEEPQETQITNSEETTTDEIKPLRAFLFNEDKEQGNVKITPETEGKSESVIVTEAAQVSVKVSKNVKKSDDGVDKNLKKRDAEVSNDMQKSNSETKRKGKKKTLVDNSPLRSTDNSTKPGMKGKVQDFVKMFNHEVPSTPQEGISRSKSYRWKPCSNSGVESEKSFDAPKAKEKVQLPSANKMRDSTQNVNQNVSKPETTNKYSQVKMSTPQTKDYSGQKAAPSVNESKRDDKKSKSKRDDQKAESKRDDQRAESKRDDQKAESKRDDRKVSVGSIDDLFGGNYVVEELFEDHGQALDTNGKSEDIQASDAKIRQWSQGRKGNIRSLLSTLQFVLWPESGWKPVALVDLLEANAVKRSYQRALLYLHPDKLQQKGAASHQKYIAEKVFDILQEAWDHFNSLGSI